MYEFTLNINYFFQISDILFRKTIFKNYHIKIQNILVLRKHKENERSSIFTVEVFPLLWAEASGGVGVRLRNSCFEH